MTITELWNSSDTTPFAEVVDELIDIEGFDFLTTFSAVAATINNIGPGLGQVGPLFSFAELSDLSKVTLSFAMLAGRLELFPILILFTPRTWKK